MRFTPRTCPQPPFPLTTKTDRPYYEEDFQPGDYLVFGRETRGLPESLLARPGASSLLTIPMAPAARSLNLATAVGIVLFEACGRCGSDNVWSAPGTRGVPPASGSGSPPSCQR